MALDFFAGCIGGFAGIIVGHPFDTIKVRLQTGVGAGNGIIGTCHTIVRNEGMFAFYKGVTSPMYAVMSINAVIFGVQGNVIRAMSNPDALSSHAFSGAIAGITQCVIASPMELAKSRLQIQQDTKSRLYKGPLDCVKVIYNSEGIRGVYRGMGLTVAREAPSFATYFYAYEWLCRKLDSDDGSQLSTPKLLLAGGFAGMASWFFTYPIDVIKTCFQTDSQGQYKNAMDCAQQLYAKHGYKRFTAGLGATMLRAFPTNAATFAAVEWTLRLMRQAEEEGTNGMISMADMTPYERHQWQHHGHVDSHEVDVFPVHP